MSTLSLTSADASFDPLLTCLLQLAKLEHQPCSAAVVTAGLPLVDERLTPELFVRAAQRVGLKSQIVKRELADLSPLVLPLVLLLEDNNAVVLVEIDHSREQALVLDLETDGQQRLSLQKLADSYTGYCIFSRPAFRFDARTQDVKVKAQGHWFWGVMRKSWRIYRDVLLAALLINLFAIANPLFVMNVYDRVVPNNALETLWVLAVGVSIVYAFDLLLKMLRSYFLEVAGKKSDVLLSAFILERVLGAQLSERPASVGAFASQLREFETVRNFITSSTVVAFVDLPFSVLFLIAIVYIGGSIVYAPLVGMLLIIAYAFYLQRPLRHAVEQTYQAGAQKHSTLIEALSGMETVKSLGAEGRIQQAWEGAIGHLAGWGQKMRLISTSATTVAAAIQQFAGVAVVLIGVHSIAQQEITLGALIACVILTTRCLGPMAQVAGLLVSYHQTVTAYRGLETVVHRTQERDDDSHYVQRPRLQGAIEFNKVSFNYPDEEQISLQQVSFSIRAGERVGIIGRIGSGKSTLQKLVMGLYQPQQGSILIDNVDLKQIDPADVRRNIGYVPQDIVLFYGSIRDNIVYGTPHTEDAEVLRAAQISGVSEFVNTHPNGFNRAVGERGQALSGGQRQSVAVARAVLNNPPIYLFDEPSTAMDNSSEKHLLDQLEVVTKGSTLLMVTHKTALLSLVDRVLVLDNGRLIADGPKEPVLEALRKGQLRVN